MTFDMSQFYAVFFEEAAEHLATMESLLLAVDRANPDTEQLNAIFRAAHSIKGSSGTFGFTDMAEVTHVLESLLDRVRKGEMGLSEEMVDAFLDAGDVLKRLLGAHQGEGEAEPEEVRRVCRRLETLSGSTDASASETRVLEESSGAGTERGTSLSPGHFHIRFVLESATGTASVIFGNLIAELRGLGEVAVEVGPDANDPSKPCVLNLATETGPDLIHNVLEFVAASESIEVARVGRAFETLEDAADGSYGFFDAPDTGHSPCAEAVGAVQTSNAGMHGESNGAAMAACQADPGYGFFNELAPEPAMHGPECEEPKPASGPAPTPSAVAPAATNAGKPGSGNSGTPASKPARDAGSIRVGVEKVDLIINLVGELVITQAMLTQSASSLDPVVFERLMNGLVQLERNTRDLQEAVMSIRMVPISMVFSRFPRVVRDISQKLGKQVELRMTGESTDLDKGLIERIADPLTHLVRNSLDHGIESPDARRAAGKRETGVINLRAYHKGGSIVIEVEDDGAGLNRDKILAKARERGLAVSDDASDQELWQLIFEAGFSTAQAVTEVSGRGVGMDVVKRNIHAMGGRVEIESALGVGTRMTVRLPLTLAILDGMSVMVGEETYIIPLTCVVESLQVEEAALRTLVGRDRVLRVRGEYLPVVELREALGLAPDAQRPLFVLLEADGARAALQVDALVGQQQVVIKSLETNYRKVAGVSGATILGDGRVALILDVGSLIATTQTRLREAA